MFRKKIGVSAYLKKTSVLCSAKGLKTSSIALPLWFGDLRFIVNFVGFGCATILWHMRRQTGEFAAESIPLSEQSELFTRTAVLRKTSMSSRLRTVEVRQTGSYPKLSSPEAATKVRSVSQVVPPTFFQSNHSPTNLNSAMSHPSWTCAGTLADLLVVGLTELAAPVMSPQMANSWGYFDMEKLSWDKEP